MKTTAEQIATYKIAVRDDLSFTAREGHFNNLNNWKPVRPPKAPGDWHVGVAIGHQCAEEILRLAEESEKEAYDAIRFAFNAGGWRTNGSGVEFGFSEAIASLAVLGMRSLRNGTARLDPDKEWPQKDEED